MWSGGHDQHFQELYYIHVQGPLARNSSVLNFALRIAKKIEIRSELRKCGFALLSPDSTFSTVSCSHDEFMFYDIGERKLYFH